MPILQQKDATHDDYNGNVFEKLQLKVLGKLVCIIEQVKEFYFMMWQHQFNLEDLKSNGRIRDKLERHLRKHFRN